MIFCFNYWEKTSTTTRDFFFFFQPCYTEKIVLRRPACDMSNSLNCSRPPTEVAICGLLELYFKHCTSGTVSINIGFICGILLCWSARINTLWIFKHISAAGVASNLPRWHSHLCLRSCSALWSQVWSAETYLDEARGRWGFSCSQQYQNRNFRTEVFKIYRDIWDDLLISNTTSRRAHFVSAEANRNL